MGAGGAIGSVSPDAARSTVSMGAAVASGSPLLGRLGAQAGGVALAAVVGGSPGRPARAFAARRARLGP